MVFLLLLFPGADDDDAVDEDRSVVLATARDVLRSTQFHWAYVVSTFSSAVVPFVDWRNKRHFPHDLPQRSFVTEPDPLHDHHNTIDRRVVRQCPQSEADFGRGCNRSI